jgi:putative hydrolase of the HAD superfamily
MNTKQSYHNIIFDLFGVCVFFEWEQAIVDILVNDAERLTPLFMQFFKSESWFSYKKGLLTEAELEKTLPEEISPILLHRVLEDMALYAQPVKEVIDLLMVLKDKGYRLYLLTNVMPITFDCFMQRFSFMQLFDGIMPSFQAGVLKPDAEIYKKFLEKFQIQASSCLFIDDKAEFVAAARQVGIDGIVYTSYADLKTELLRRGVL